MCCCMAFEYPHDFKSLNTLLHDLHVHMFALPCSKSFIVCMSFLCIQTCVLLFPKTLRDFHSFVLGLLCGKTSNWIKNWWSFAHFASVFTAIQSKYGSQYLSWCHPWVFLENSRLDMFGGKYQFKSLVPINIWKQQNVDFSHKSQFDQRQMHQQW